MIFCFAGDSTSNLDFRGKKTGNITGLYVTKRTRYTYILIFYSYFEDITSQSTESIIIQEGMQLNC